MSCRPSIALFHRLFRQIPILFTTIIGGGLALIALFPPHFPPPPPPHPEFELLGSRYRLYDANRIWWTAAIARVQLLPSGTIVMHDLNNGILNDVAGNPYVVNLRANNARWDPTTRLIILSGSVKATILPPTPTPSHAIYATPLPPNPITIESDEMTYAQSYTELQGNITIRRGTDTIRPLGVARLHHATNLASIEAYVATINGFMVSGNRLTLDMSTGVMECLNGLSAIRYPTTSHHPHWRIQRFSRFPLSLTASQLRVVPNQGQDTLYFTNAIFSQPNYTLQANTIEWTPTQSRLMGRVIMTASNWAGLHQAPTTIRHPLLVQLRQQPLRIVADSCTIDWLSNRTIWLGNVQLTQPSLQMTAQQMSLDDTSQQLILIGGVQVTHRNHSIATQQLSLFMATETMQAKGFVTTRLSLSR